MPSNNENKIKLSNNKPSFISSFFYFIIILGFFNIIGIMGGLIAGKGLLIGSKLSELESPNTINQIRIILYESLILKRPVALFVIVYCIFRIRNFFSRS